MTDDTLYRWEDEAAVLELRAKGIAPKDIAVVTGFDLTKINRVIRDAADRLRKTCHERCKQRFCEHDARCEYLYRLCVERLETVGFDEKTLRAAVHVLERQAKLLGLDKARGPDSPAANSLDSATTADLVREAERLGMTVPDSFKVSVGVV